MKRNVPLFPAATSEFEFHEGAYLPKEDPQQLNEIPIPKGAEGCLLGIQFVVTGIMPSLTKEQLKELIQEYGGSVTSNVCDQTDVVIRGYTNVSHKKIQKAQKRGIQIVDQEGLFSFLKQSNNQSSSNNQSQDSQSIQQPQQNSTQSTNQQQPNNTPIANSQSTNQLQYSDYDSDYDLNNNSDNDSNNDLINNSDYDSNDYLINNSDNDSNNDLINNSDNDSDNNSDYYSAPKIYFDSLIQQQQNILLSQGEKEYITKYIEEKRELQILILQYLEDQGKIEENYQNFENYIIKHKIREDKNEIKCILHLISKIADNHNRSNNFIQKIEHLLLQFKEEIKSFSNFAIFNIFKRNKRILLFLFEEKILFPDKIIASIISKGKYLKRNYPIYFFPEFKDLFDRDFSQKIELKFISIENFEEKRKSGENDQYVCELIRNDSIEEFITYVNRNNLKVDSYVQESIFETNLFLLKMISIYSKKYFQEISLICYAAFYGSVQIFKYIKINVNEPNTSWFYNDIWEFAVHGNHPEIIHILTDEEITPFENKYLNCFVESIKCHHTDVTTYIQNNLLEDLTKKDDIMEYEIDYSIIFMRKKMIEYAVYGGFNNYNFFYILNPIQDILNTTPMAKLFDIFCKYDYIYLVKFLLNDTRLNLFTQIKDFECEIDDGIYKISLQTCLHLAAEKSNFEMFQLLFNSRQFDINTFSYMYDNEDPKIVDRTYEKDEGGRICDKKTVLHIAVEKNNYELIEFLLKIPQIDVNCTSIHMYEWYKRGNVGFDHIEEQKTPLQISVENNIPEVVLLLLSHPKINVNVIFKPAYFWSYKSSYDFIEMKFTKTILQIAVENLYSDIVQLLLTKKEIDINFISEYFFKTNNYVNSFIYSNKDYCDNKCPKNEKYNYINPFYDDSSYQLTEKEEEDCFNIYYIDHYKKTALHVAIENQDLDTIKLLLNNDKIDVNINTIFKWAILKCRGPYVYNEDIKKLNEKSQIVTTLQIARSSFNEEIIELLSKHIATKI